MNLNEHYNHLYTKSIAEIKSDKYDIDKLIGSKRDNRFGISLIIRPSDEVKNEIQKFLAELRKIEPYQYYYPNSDIHITILSIISCYEGFELKMINPLKYIEIIKKFVSLNEKTKIQFNGLTVANSCVMLKGFVSNDSINDLRINLRSAFKDSKLEQSLDQRYLLQTTHSTIVRLREKLKNKDAFLKLIDTYVAYEFGTFEIKNIELVYNDWYQQAANVSKLYEFKY